LRQTIESINQTLRASSTSIAPAGTRPPGSWCASCSILALTAAIWHNDHTAAPVHRSLTAYDH
jgi:hypothetical protein